MCMMVNYVRKMIVKKSCKFGEYGLFEPMLILFIFTVCSVCACLCVHMCINILLTVVQFNGSYTNSFTQ